MLKSTTILSKGNTLYMKESFYTGRFDSIQALRGLAALSVVLHHISFIENGSFGVDIFFCISGFIMMYVTHLSTKNFLIKRVIRIVPLYYFITIATFMAMIIFPYLFDRSSADLIVLIKSFFFIPTYFAGEIQPIVRVGWTLNYEFFFYLILWISMKINVKYRGLIASSVLAVFVIAGRMVSYKGAVMSFYTDTILIEFIFGIAAYELLRRINYEKCKYSREGLIVISVICYVFMFSVKYIGKTSGYDRVLVYGIPALILFICTFISLYRKKIPKAFVFLGDISYSVYLFHYLIARYYDRILDKYGYDNIWLRMASILVFVSAIAIGSASYYLFEVKLNKLLRKKLNV